MAKPRLLKTPLKKKKGKNPDVFLKKLFSCFLTWYMDRSLMDQVRSTDFYWPVKQMQEGTLHSCTSPCPYKSKPGSLSQSAAMPMSWITAESLAPGSGKPFLAQLSSQRSTFWPRQLGTWVLEKQDAHYIQLNPLRHSPQTFQVFWDRKIKAQTIISLPPFPLTAPPELHLIWNTE